MIFASTQRLALVLLLAGGVVFAEEKKKEDEEPEKKPGFFSRVTKSVGGLFTKDKPDESSKNDKAKETEKEKPKEPASSKPKPKGDSPPKTPARKGADTSEKPKTAETKASKPAATKTTSKSEPKKEMEVAKKKEPAPSKPETPKTDAPKPEPKKEEKKVVASVSADKGDKEKAQKKESESRKGDGGEFDDLSAAFGAGMKPEPASPSSSKSEQAKLDAKILAEPLPPPPPLPASDGSWEIVKLDHDYVTMESIQRFYRFSTLKREGSTVWMRSPTIILKAQIGSQDLIINNIKFVLSYAVTEARGKALISRLDLCKLLDPVLMPSHITSSELFDTVVIDAGHGGHDSGAKGVYGYEKDFTLQMAAALRDACQKRGFKTVLTRSTDEFISLSGRVAIANATPRSIFVSLHFNSSNASANGIETWALTPAGSSSTFMGSRGWDNAQFKGNTRDSENIALATAIHGMVIHSVNTANSPIHLQDRGIKRARWSVLTGCTRPGVLFEGGFVTNSQECRLIAAPNYRQFIADCICTAIVNYRKALQPRVVQPTVK